MGSAQCLSIKSVNAGAYMRTKYAYVWTGLRACITLSENGLHTVRHELKFVGFLREHKGNRMWVVLQKLPQLSDNALFSSTA